MSIHWRTVWKWHCLFGQRKIVWRQGDSIIGRARIGWTLFRLKITTNVRQRCCMFWKMIILLELIYVDTQMDSNGLFCMSTDLLWYFLSGVIYVLGCHAPSPFEVSDSPAIFHFPGCCVKKFEGHRPRAAMFHPRIALVTLQLLLAPNMFFCWGLEKQMGMVEPLQ